MSNSLPPAIATYFTAANAHDPDAILACFASDAVVHDEGREMRGAAAIRAWVRETSQKYSPRFAIIESAPAKDGETVVTAEVSGEFPGSPIALRFRFVVERDRITALEIKP